LNIELINRFIKGLGL